MISDLTMSESNCTLMSDYSSMDASVVERLRATVEVSLQWADQTLDVLIRLDDDLQALDAMVEQQAHLPGLEQIVNQAQHRVQGLRRGVRDVMMSMQQQDVIGQAIERAAAALEKRTAALEKVVGQSDGAHLPTNEVAEIHRAYRAEDNLHRASSEEQKKYNAEEYNAEEYNAAA